MCGGTGGERGLLGFTHDPAFLSNGFVYVYYTHSAPGLPGDCANRVSRFTLTAVHASIRRARSSCSTTSRRDGGNHNGGNVEIGSDGFLYVSVGDAGVDPRGDAGVNDAAQDLSLLNGKILRITLDGQPGARATRSPAPTVRRCAMLGISAPTVDTQCQEIFAWGLRNPYRFAFDRNDGSDRFFINDVGQSTREEVDLGALGANYGWPEREGQCARGGNPPCAPPTAASGFTATAHRLRPQRSARSSPAARSSPTGCGRTCTTAPTSSATAVPATSGSGSANGSVDYAAPFATGASGLSDMTFGFDANGRMVLYYVAIGGGLRKITPTTPAASGARNDLRMMPITPFRAYDTGPNQPAIGVAAGKVFNGTTRRIDLDPPGAYEAALVNVTYDNNAGAGFVRLWGTHALRPATSSLNADAADTIGANAAIVPLDGAGRFMLESTITSRIVVDVMAWLERHRRAGQRRPVRPAHAATARRHPAGGGHDARVGERQPVHAPGGDIEFDADGRLGVPSDGTASAVVLSIGAIAGPGPGGFAGAFPTGTTWSNTSNVNVVGADIRANMVVVPLGTNGHVSLRTLNVADVVVDVLGYVTSTSGAGVDVRALLVDRFRPDRRHPDSARIRPLRRGRRRPRSSSRSFRRVRRSCRT